VLARVCVRACMHMCVCVCASLRLCLHVGGPDELLDVQCLDIRYGDPEHIARSCAFVTCVICKQGGLTAVPP